MLTLFLTEVVISVCTTSLINYNNLKSVVSNHNSEITQGFRTKIKSVDICDPEDFGNCLHMWQFMCINAFNLNYTL